MAGVQTIEEEFLTCSICMEIYTDPCTLTCGHSLCRTCVTQFIKSRPDAVQSRTIPCPFCRQVTPVPRPGRPVDEWAGQIRPSLILQGLMDRHHSGHKHQEGHDICFLCKEVGETTLASSWCSDCEVTLCSRCAKMHLKGPSTNKHEVLDLSQGPNVKQRRKVKCKEHEGELIKFICKDCNKAACQTCCIIKHRTCKLVVTIESMVPEIKSALTEKRRIIEQKMKQNFTNLMHEETKIGHLKNSKTRGEEHIKLEAKTVIGLVKTKEAELLMELSEAYDKQITEHQANVKSGQITTQMYQQHCEFIDQALQSEFEVDMYDMYQVCLSGAVEYVGDIEPDTRNTPVEGEVKFTQNMEPMKKAIAEMCKVSWRGEKSTPNILSTPVVYDTIDIKHSEDRTNPESNDVTVLTVDSRPILVAVDFKNTSLKSVDLMSKTTYRLQLTNSPLKIAKMTRLQVATTTNNRYIVIAEVKPTLVLISSVKTKKQYRGLSSLSDSTLAAGSYSPPSVDILDFSGNVLRSFTSTNIDLDHIQTPNNLCTTYEGNILVSDRDSKSVYCLTPDGRVVFTYHPTGDRALGFPQGITVTDTGDILVTDGGLQKIVQLTSDGTFMREIHPDTWHGIAAPWGLSFGDTDKLYMCLGENKQPVIKVLLFKQN